MTIIVAVQKEGVAAMAADVAGHDGAGLIPVDNYRKRKVLDAGPDSWIAIPGRPDFSDLWVRYERETPDECLDFTTPNKAGGTIERWRAWVERQREDIKDLKETEWPRIGSISEGGILYLTWDGWAAWHRRYLTLGDQLACAAADGVCETLYGHGSWSAEMVAREAVRVACKLRPGFCALDENDEGDTRMVELP